MIMGKIYTLQHVVTASCAAHRLNSTYFPKAKWPDRSDEAKKPNKDIMLELLAMSDEVSDTFLPEDHEKAQQVISYFRGLIFKKISNELHGFMETAFSVINSDEISTSHQLGVIAVMPNIYEKNKVRNDNKSRITFSRGGFLGTVDGKVETSIEVLGSVYSKQWETWYITALTDDDCPVFFAYKDNLPLNSKHTIKGNVKRHRDDGMTQLNRVKIV